MIINITSWNTGVLRYLICPRPDSGKTDSVMNQQFSDTCNVLWQQKHFSADHINYSADKLHLQTQKIDSLHMFALLQDMLDCIMKTKQNNSLVKQPEHKFVTVFKNQLCSLPHMFQPLEAIVTCTDPLFLIANKPMLLVISKMYCLW